MSWNISHLFFFFFPFAIIRKEQYGAADDADRFETVSLWDISRGIIYALSRAGRSHDDRQKRSSDSALLKYLGYVACKMCT